MKRPAKIKKRHAPTTLAISHQFICASPIALSNMTPTKIATAPKERVNPRELAFESGFGLSPEELMVESQLHQREHLNRPAGHMHRALQCDLFGGLQIRGLNHEISRNGL